MRMGQDRIGIALNKQLYCVNVRGRTTEWSFPVWSIPEYVQQWRDDGLIVDEIVNTVPLWVVNLGLLDVWVWLQDRGWL